ncbi:MAG TPA: endolytic transglycosylase MltG, partial [Bacillales bacterium]|nr:endolytic transglycosylase MltG [Bacillales bacterium]
MFEVNDQEMATRAKEAKLVRKIVFFVVVGIVVVLTAVIGGGAYYVQNALEPVNPDSDKTVKVYIERGSSVTEIAQQLESRNIINSSLVFRYYVKYKNAGGFQAGTHTFSPSMPIDEVIDQLRKTGKAKNVTKLKLTFAEGLSLQDIAGIIAEKTDLQKHDILKKMKDRKYIKNTYMDEYWFLNEVILDEDIRYPLEGYLFPAT